MSYDIHKILVNDLEDILIKYSESHRYYHNINHITRMFAIANENEIKLSPEQQLAILYHYYVYEINPPYFGYNEEQSAEYAYKKTKNGVVRDIILCTISHTPYILKKYLSGNVSSYIEQARTIIDLDLWDLSNQTKFIENNVKIKKETMTEFSFLTYIKKSAKFYEAMLERDSIYVSKYSTKEMEEQARINISNEYYNLIGRLKINKR